MRVKEQGRKGNGLLAAVLLAAMMTGCAQEHGSAVLDLAEGQSDLEYVQSKGTLVVGITDFAPLDYREDEGWTGFDAALAEAFAESLGVAAIFSEIDWEKKTELLADGSIDCIWNGMTMTEELQEAIACSEPYLSNAQVVVMRKDGMEQYDTMEACQHLLFAVEAGSTGEALLKEKKYRYTAYDTQKEALQSVSSKQTDATVIDVIMAAYYTGDGQAFEELGYRVPLNDETICIGFRRQSDLKEAADAFLKNAYEDGTAEELAERYGIANALLY